MKVSPDCSGLPPLSEEEHPRNKAKEVVEEEEGQSRGLFCSIWRGVHLPSGREWEGFIWDGKLSDRSTLGTAQPDLLWHLGSRR